MDSLVSSPLSTAAPSASLALRKPSLLRVWRLWTLMLLAVATLSAPASAALTVTCPANRIVSTTPTTCDAVVNHPAATATTTGLLGPNSLTLDADGNVLIVQCGLHQASRDERVLTVFGVAATGLLVGQPFPDP